MLSQFKSRFSLSTKPQEWVTDPATDPSEVVIAVMGVTGSGKSSFIKAATKREDIKIGHGLKSETQEVSSYQCRINGISFVLVDTPGFNDTFRNEKEILQEITAWLSLTYASGKRLNALLYFHPITSCRIEGSSLLSLRMFRELCGPDCYRHIFLCTTFWDITDNELGVRRERELCESPDAWGHMKQQGSTVLRINGYDGVHEIMFRIANKQKVTLNVQKEIVEEQMAIEQTSAGRIINHESAKMEQEVTSQLHRFKENTERKTSSREAQHARILKRQNERFIRFQQEQQRLLEEQRKQNEKRQNDLREAAELRAQEEKRKMLRLEAQARQRLRDQMQEKKRLEERRLQLEAQKKAQAEQQQCLRRWSSRAKHITLCEQQEGAFRLALNRGLVRANVRIHQTPAFSRTCGFCGRLIGFRSFQRCNRCNYDVFQNCLIERGVDNVGFSNGHFTMLDPNDLPPRCCNRLNPNHPNSAISTISCSLCQQVCQGYCFHCCDCSFDDFDLCLRCLTLSSTCYDNRHILHKMACPHPT